MDPFRGDPPHTGPKHQWKMLIFFIRKKIFAIKNKAINGPICPISMTMVRYVPSWNHYDITKPHSPHSGPKHQYFFILHVTRLPQKDICDQKHAVWPNLSRLVQRIKHRKSHNSEPSTHSHINSDVILIEILRRGNAKNKTLHFGSVPATEPILSFLDE